MSTEYLQIHFECKFEGTDAERKLTRAMIEERVRVFLDQFKELAEVTSHRVEEDLDAVFRALRDRFVHKMIENSKRAGVPLRVELSVEDSMTVLVGSRRELGDGVAQQLYTEGLGPVFYGISAAWNVEGASRLVYMDGSEPF